MEAVIFLAAVMVGATVMALVFGDGLYRSRRRNLPPVIDLAAARRLRALGDAVKRHPSGGGRS
jgi:hypothetical protein